jgi:hypothetical protein
MSLLLGLRALVGVEVGACAKAVQRAGGAECLTPGLVACRQLRAHVLERGVGAVVQDVGDHGGPEALESLQPEQHVVAADREAFV